MSYHRPQGQSTSTPSALHQSPKQAPPTEDEEDGGMMPGGGEENIFRDMTFDEVLEDLHARFLVNLPKEEMTLVRIYWQAEQAHWFYEDYLRPLNPLLPALSQRHFTQLIISSSPLYSSLAADEGVDYDEVWAEYIAYKSMVPCCGGILINEAGDKCIMVRGWKSSAGWCFPRGKINSNEAEVDCAIREVEEEVGFDLTGWINSKDSIQTQISAQTVTMFIAKGIPESTKFEPQTRKEIGAIEWVRMVDLPTWTGKRPKKTSGVKEKKFYNVTPFVGPLKRWLQEHGINPNQPGSSKKKNQQNNHHTPSSQQMAQPYRDLQPFAFDNGSNPERPHETTALDNLFHKFIHKQEEDLGRNTPEKVAGGDNKAGLERLFGNMRSAPQAERPKEEEGDEDALARLLGAVALPLQQAPPPPAETKHSKLLAVLNQPKTPTLPAATLASETPSRSHQASLLSMLSPKQSAPAPQASAPPTSPHSISPDVPDAERARRQRALLELTVAGMGPNPPAANAPPPGSTIKSPRHVSQPGQPIPIHSSTSTGSLQPSPTRNRPPPPPYEAHAPTHSSGYNQARPPTSQQAQGIFPAMMPPSVDQGRMFRPPQDGMYDGFNRPIPIPNYAPTQQQMFARPAANHTFRPPGPPGPPLPPMMGHIPHGIAPQHTFASHQQSQQYNVPYPSTANFGPRPPQRPPAGGPIMSIPAGFPPPRPPMPTGIMQAQSAPGPVHQPVPRPPNGIAGGLLAMLNDRNGQ